jgi:putative tryptophan/tyrosine transport system substrate-binding protein
MRRRQFLSLAASAGAASAFGPRAVHAQPAAGAPRIAILSIPVPSSAFDFIAEGLANYGYVEGRNIVTQRFTAPTTPEVPAYAARAVASQPAAILCLGTPPTREAMRATATIPIVMLAVNDPLGNGFIASYAHPGGNVTGNTGTASDVIGKQLALLKELVPGLRRLAVAYLGADPSAARVIAGLGPAARALNLEPVLVDFTEAQDFATQLGRVAVAGVGGFMTISSQYFNTRRSEILDFEIRNRIPWMDAIPNAVPLPGVIAYGANLNTLYRQSGYYVDAILKGRRPADLPVQQPTQFDLALNLSTARAMGLSVPPSILVQATIVVK